MTGVQTCALPISGKVFDTTIARTVRFPETTVAGEPITSYASSSIGAAAYRRLAREIISMGGVR